MSHPRMLLPLLIPLLMTLLTGCESKDERLARLATESADRQARQNEEMVRLNREVTEGNRRVAEASAAARQENLTMQKDLQAQRSNLETDRQSFSAELRKESLLIPVLEWLGMLIVVSLPLVVCWLLLTRNRDETGEIAMGELLIEELVSSNPKLLPPFSPTKPLGQDPTLLLPTSDSAK